MNVDELKVSRFLPINRSENIRFKGSETAFFDINFIKSEYHCPWEIPYQKKNLNDLCVQDFGDAHRMTEDYLLEITFENRD